MFEWDEAKNQLNIDRHGVDFALARLIFEGFRVSWVDDRFDYGEVREVSVGAVGSAAILTVVHTDQRGVTRLISARLAKRNERKRYEAALQKSFNA